MREHTLYSVYESKVIFFINERMLNELTSSIRGKRLRDGNYPRARHNHARVLKITTPHGEVLTPAFMPGGTRAFVNHLSPEDLAAAGSQIILGGNTYHMLVNPGMEVIRAGGGMHRFMGWDGPMLTDSGGFQVFSLTRAKHCRIDETGAHFKHPGTG